MKYQLVCIQLDEQPKRNGKTRQRSTRKTGGGVMADGMDCTCAARSEYECGCGADWTPKELVDLYAENEKLTHYIAQLEAENSELKERLHREEYFNRSK